MPILRMARGRSGKMATRRARPFPRKRPNHDCIEKRRMLEIYRLFDWYDFRDPIGHPLTNNLDFRALVNVYLKAPKIFTDLSCMSREEADLRHAIIRAFLDGRKFEAESSLCRTASCNTADTPRQDQPQSKTD